MLYPKIEECIEKMGSKYALAVVVGKRAKELTFKMPGEFTGGNVKEISYALTEIESEEIVLQAISGANSAHA